MKTFLGRRHGPGAPVSPAPAGPALPVGDDHRFVVLRSGAGAAPIAATVLASLVAFFDASIVTVAVPPIGRDLGASTTGVQWVVTGYLLTGAALLLLSGALIDHFGQHRILVAGLLVMLVA
jgi:MFS family permease